MKTLHHRLTASFAVAFVSLCSVVMAEPWARFRGPNGSGIAPALDIADVWTEAAFRWKTTLPGEGHSSPVIWGQRLFVTSAADKGEQRYVHCLDTRTGEIVWTVEHRASTHKKHLRNSYATSTPAVDAKHVYVCWGTPDEYTFIALDHDGKEAWRRELDAYGGGHGAGCSPIVYRDMVILSNIKPSDGYLLALDSTTGDVRWKVPRTDDTRPPYSTPCVFDQPGFGEVLIFTDCVRGIEAIDPRTGDVVWAAQVFGEGSELRSIGSPIVYDAMVIGSAGAAAGKKTIIALKPDSADSHAKPTTVFELSRNMPQIPTPLAKDGLLFLWSEQGIVICADAQTGETIWQERVGGNYFGSPICVGNRLLAISEQGEVVVLAASREFQELGRTQLGEPSSSTPAVGDGALFLRTLSHVYAVGAKP